VTSQRLHSCHGLREGSSGGCWVHSGRWAERGRGRGSWWRHRCWKRSRVIFRTFVWLSLPWRFSPYISLTSAFRLNRWCC